MREMSDFIRRANSIHPDRKIGFLQQLMEVVNVLGHFLRTFSFIQWPYYVLLE